MSVSCNLIDTEFNLVHPLPVTFLIVPDIEDEINVPSYGMMTVMGRIFDVLNPDSISIVLAYQG